MASQYSSQASKIAIALFLLAWLDEQIVRTLHVRERPAAAQTGQCGIKVPRCLPGAEGVPIISTGSKPLSDPAFRPRLPGHDHARAIPPPLSKGKGDSEHTWPNDPSFRDIFDVVIHRTSSPDGTMLKCSWPSSSASAFASRIKRANHEILHTSTDSNAHKDFSDSICCPCASDARSHCCCLSWRAFLRFCRGKSLSRHRVSRMCSFSCRAGRRRCAIQSGRAA